MCHFGVISAPTSTVKHQTVVTSSQMFL